MHFSRVSARAGAALALLCSCGVQASTPSLLWADARKVAVNCLVQTGGGRDDAGLCARVLRLAKRDAPFPVAQVEAGDPALIDSATVTLLVHASVERTPRGRTIAFTIRPYRASDPNSETLFGTAPKAVDLPSSGPAPALDTALGEALAEILPWQRPSGLIARPL
jgi:hypothetical protein